MGLSASQARLLSLTGRMHDIEYRAQHLEAKKLQLANDSDHVYRNYQDALNAAKIQVRQINNDGSSTFVNATYNVMKDMGYEIRFDNLPVVSSTTYSNFLRCGGVGGNRDYFMALETNRINPLTMKNCQDGCIEIYTAEQLIECLESGGSGKNYRLMSDIDMTGKEWNEEGKNFEYAIFDGNGHSITGLGQSLFKNLWFSDVKNLSLSGNITNNGTSQKDHRAFLSTYASNSYISNVTVNGSINNECDPRDNLGVGGLVAVANGVNTRPDGQVGTKIENCSANVYIDSVSVYTGGLVGEVHSTVNINNCSSSGVVNGYSSVGGLIGGTDMALAHKIDPVNVTIENCSSSATVNGEDFAVGGFIGSIGATTFEDKNGTRNEDSFVSIENCYATGDTTSDGTHTSYAGNFVGFIQAERKYESGDHNSTIATGYNEGNVVIANSSGFGDVTTIDSTTGNPVIQKNFAGANELTNVAAENSNTSSVSITPPHIEKTVKVDDIGASEAGGIFDALVESGGKYTPLESSPVAGYEDDYHWFTNYLKEGLILLYKKDELTGEWLATNVATDVDLQEVVDDVAIKKAEATYESDMRKINNKDKKYDTELGSLESERTAIKTEMDTLKIVAKDNIDKTFKLFS